jgi:hypothetical protein
MFTDGSRLDDGATGYAVAWQEGQSWVGVRNHMGYNQEAYEAECAALASALEEVAKRRMVPERVTIFSDLWNRRERQQLAKPIFLTSRIGPLESTELAVNVRPQKRPAVMGPVNRVKNCNDGPSSTFEQLLTNCSILRTPTGKDAGDGGVLAGLVE